MEKFFILPFLSSLNDQQQKIKGSIHSNKDIDKNVLKNVLIKRNKDM